MKRFVPAGKLSKKEQKRLNAAVRGNWHGVRPVTRVADTDKRRYKRRAKHIQKAYGDES